MTAARRTYDTHLTLSTRKAAGAASGRSRPRPPRIYYTYDRHGDLVELAGPVPPAAALRKSVV